MFFWARLKRVLARQWQKSFSQIFRQEIISLILLFCFFGVILFFLNFFYLKKLSFSIKQSENLISSQIVQPQEENNFFRKIDGLIVSTKESENPPLVAAVIENMIEAQPVSGLEKASLVYEALVEANITRFLAFYPIDKNQQTEDFVIGPIRSARPYFLIWAKELNALFAHVGSSPEADRLIKQGKVSDLDQWFKDKFFWRDEKRARPHNVYTSFNLLSQAVEKEKFLQKDFSSWQFKDDSPETDRGNVAQIMVNYLSPYDVLWKYDRKSNDYLRYQWGGKHLTADKKEIRAKNIVVLWQKMEILDEIGRKFFQTTGEGEALVFRDGQVIEARWQKESEGSRIRFFDKKTGEEVFFNRGLTWIEVLPLNLTVDY